MRKRTASFLVKKRKGKPCYVCNNRILIVPNNGYNRMKGQAQGMD